MKTIDEELEGHSFDETKKAIGEGKSVLRMRRTLKAVYLGLAALEPRDGPDDCRWVVVIEKSEETRTQLLPIPPHMKPTNEGHIFEILKPGYTTLDKQLSDDERHV